MYTNIETLTAERNPGATASVFASSVEKLTNGLRINRALSVRRDDEEYKRRGGGL
jgi:flagellin-like hook-associated protein FlgL